MDGTAVSLQACPEDDGDKKARSGPELSRAEGCGHAGAVVPRAVESGCLERQPAQHAGRRRGHNADVGRRGEDAAARFLERRGYDIVERNWTCNAGEADIIARDEETVVFVEVKTRTNCDKGLPSEAVDEAKRARYEQIAVQFLKDYDVVDVPVRFDIISLVVVSPDRAMIRHHINAFSAQ